MATDNCCLWAEHGRWKLRTLGYRIPESTPEPCHDVKWWAISFKLVGRGKVYRQIRSNNLQRLEEARLFMHLKCHPWRLEKGKLSTWFGLNFYFKAVRVLRSQKLLLLAMELTGVIFKGVIFFSLLLCLEKVDDVIIKVPFGSNVPWYV